jgi:lecithin-cholesterol acyltransferase
MRRFSFAIAELLAGCVLAVSAACTGAGGSEIEGGPHEHTTSTSQLSLRSPPVVVFPAFHFTKLTVRVNGQTVAPDCPAYGSFEDWYLNDSPDTTFSQVCQDKLLTLVYNPTPHPETPDFRDQPGVEVTIKDYGKTESAPFYEDLYAFLETKGYVRNLDIRVAGYDSRLTPDMGGFQLPYMKGFLKRTMSLIQQTYRANGNTPVHLVGHSNGPLYAQYLLTHTTQEWKNTYIHGFTPIAGNWPGQGLFYPVFFTGLNVRDFAPPVTTENAISSARMYQSHPSSYMSAADPDVIGDQIVVVRDATDGLEYTPMESLELLSSYAHPPIPEYLINYYVGFVKFRPPFYPNVDVYAEKASGLPTVVGVELPNLTVGHLLGNAPVFTRDGDGNQEDLTNDAIQVWADMPCFHFELTDNHGEGVDHFTLPRQPAVLDRLWLHLNRPKSVCPASP